MNIGQTIKEIRKLKGETQVTFAKGAGISRSSLCHTELGTYLPRMVILNKICIYLCLTIDELYLLAIDSKETAFEYNINCMQNAIRNSFKT